MIHMQMCTQNVVHCLRMHASGRQLGEEHATCCHMPARTLAFLVVANAGVKEDSMVGGGTSQDGMGKIRLPDAGSMARGCSQALWGAQSSGVVSGKNARGSKSAR